MRRRSFLAGAFWFGAGCSVCSEQPAVRPLSQKESLRRAARYLWGQQATDGGWHSQTYGLLRSGQSLTPFVLEALLHVPGDVYALPRGEVDRAITFIRRQMDSSGAVGRTDPGLEDYPNYATALAVLALCRAGSAPEVIAPMIGYLRAQQFTEQNGWQRRDPAYGAWGMGGERRMAPQPGHVDLSMTRYVLQALAAAGGRAGDPAFDKAHVFVERCQNYGNGGDGGFFFTTVVLEANKAGRDGELYRSYGTATADGILSLMAMGRGHGDPRVDAGIQWLRQHHRAGGAPGFTGESYQRWAAGLRFYYAASRAAVLSTLPLAEVNSVIVDLLGMQRPDGSWVNADPLVKEDDPLIATGLAVRALTH